LFGLPPMVVQALAHSIITKLAYRMIGFLFLLNIIQSFPLLLNTQRILRGAIDKELREEGKKLFYKCNHRLNPRCHPERNECSE